MFDRQWVLVTASDFEKRCCCGQRCFVLFWKFSWAGNNANNLFTRKDLLKVDKQNTGNLQTMKTQPVIWRDSCSAGWSGPSTGFTLSDKTLLSTTWLVVPVQLKYLSNSITGYTRDSLIAYSITYWLISSTYRGGSFYVVITGQIKSDFQTEITVFKFHRAIRR